jgi:acyl carrier protein
LAVIDDVIGVVSRTLKDVDESKVNMDTSFEQDLGADSLDLVELIMELEENYDVTIPDEDAQKLSTVGDAVRYIEANVES